MTLKLQVGIIKRTELSISYKEKARARIHGSNKTDKFIGQY